MISRSVKRLLIDISTFVILGLVLIWSLFPMYWTATTSLRKTAKAMLAQPELIFEVTLENYAAVLSDSSFLNALKNSISVTFLSTLIALAVGSLAAYGFSRFKFTASDDLSFWMISTRMFPPIAVVIPFFVMFQSVNLLDTQTALVIIYTSFNLPLVIWVMRSFIADLPKEIEEAALVDGCTQFQVISKIVLPMIRPALVATGILTMAFSWNEFLFALILTNVDAQTLPVRISSFVEERGVAWGEMAASSMIAILPILLITIWMNRYLIRGLTFGALKE